MNKRKEEYRLQLEGRWTTNVDELVDECSRIRESMERYGLRVTGYDPGVAVCDAQHPNATAEIPLWLLKRLMSSPPSPLGDTPRIPPGWKIERRDSKPFKVLNITAPNGYSSSVGSHERNPMNVLYMLAEALLEGPLGDTPEQQEQKR